MAISDRGCSDCDGNVCGEIACDGDRGDEDGSVSGAEGVACDGAVSFENYVMRVLRLPVATNDRRTH